MRGSGGVDAEEEGVVDAEEEAMLCGLLPRDPESVSEEVCAGKQNEAADERREEEGGRREEEGGGRQEEEEGALHQVTTNADATQGGGGGGGGAGAGGGYEQYSTNPTGSAPTRKTPQLKRVSLGGNLLVEVVHRERGTGRVVVLGQARVTLEGLLGLKSSKSCEERWLPLTDSNGNVLRGNEVTGGDGWLAQAALRQLPAPAGGGRGAHAGVASVVSDSTSFKLDVCLIDITHNS